MLRPGPSRRVALFLLLGFGLHVALRLWFARHRLGPLVVADESGYLVNARVLGGGADGQMSLAAFYRGGYSLLIAPAFWFSDQFTTVYRLILAENAVFTSAVFPALYALLRRAFAVARPQAMVAAFVTVFSPPLVVMSELAWTEAVLPLLVVLLALGLLAVLQASTLRRATLLGLGEGVLAGFAYSVHGRAAPLLGVLVLLLVAVAVRYPRFRLPVLAALVGLAVTAAAGAELNARLLAASWDAPPLGEFDKLTSHLRTVAGWQNIGGLGAGEVWYLLATSLGLLGVGVVVGLRAGLGDVRARREDAPPATAAVVVLLVGGLLGVIVLVGAFLFPASRPDMLVYGRYCEVVAPPLIALGLATVLVQARLRTALIAVLGVAAAVLLCAEVVHHYRPELLDRPSSSLNAVAMPLLSGSLSQLNLTRATWVALLLVVVLAALTRLPRRAAVALPALLVLTYFSAGSYLMVHRQLRHATVNLYGVVAAPAALADVPGLADAAEIAYDASAYTVTGMWTYPLALPHSHLVLFRSADQQIPAQRFVISSKTWAQAGALRARVVWQDPVTDQAVYEVPGRS